MRTRTSIDLQAVAALGCRLLAILFAVHALAQVAMLAFADAALYVVASGVLWFLAKPIGGWLARQSGHEPYKLLPATFARWLLVATGLLIAAGAIEPLVQIFSALLQGQTSAAQWIGVGVIVAARLTLGLSLVLAADLLVQWLMPALPEVPEPPALEEQSVTELIGGLVNAAGALGIRRATDLAMTLKTEAEGVAKRVVRSSLDAVIAAVELRRPDFSASTAADGTVTIAFSDMEGFTAMTQRLGDHAAHQVIKAHNHIVRRAVRAHGGQEVELQGDGFLLAFPEPARALQCAAAIQAQCAEYSRRHPETPVRVRIGLHCGTPIKEGDRFFGITVILAARIAAQAAGGEVLVSDAMREALPADADFRFSGQRVTELKGLSGKHRMHVLDWATA
ncbi:MAG: adenylate/guanylate cyclase domain-containing protein [Pseudomonadota bacterium]|nr:adenylate/guanylate cyclase domain-containing protein [Pseudomonadota bacterium]